MNKIINYTLLFLLFLLTNCAYEPVLKNKNYQFSINIVKINGDKNINSIISKNIKNLKEKEKKYDLTLTSNQEKIIISKNSKGDPSIFELQININYVVKENGKTLIENNINRKTTYNNITDKFELESYEKTIIQNLSSAISDDIMLSISHINE